MLKKLKTTVARFVKAIVAFLEADIGFKILCLKVLLLLGIGRVSVLLLSFKKIANWISNTEEKSIYNLPLELTNKLMRVRKAIESVSRFTPWNSNCFAQALCAHWILKRMGINHTTYFGLKKGVGANSMKAHAWLRVDKFIVTGRKGHKQFTEIGEFYYDALNSIS